MSQTKDALRSWDCFEYRIAGLGVVDEYVVRDGGPHYIIRTVQLAAGTPPRSAVFTVPMDIDGTVMPATVSAVSNYGRVTDSKIVVTHAWYRPGRLQFDSELKSVDRAHVLKGGLLLAPLEKAVSLNMRAHPEWPDCEKDWEAFVHAAYGVKPVGKSVESDSTLAEYFKPEVGGEAGGA